MQKTPDSSLSLAKDLGCAFPVKLPLSSRASLCTASSKNHLHFGKITLMPAQIIPSMLPQGSQELSLRGNCSSCLINEVSVLARADVSKTVPRLPPKLLQLRIFCLYLRHLAPNAFKISWLFPWFNLNNENSDSPLNPFQLVTKWVVFQ